MENTQQFNPDLAPHNVRTLRTWSVDSNSDTNKYVVPLWIQEVAQILKSQNEQKMLLTQAGS
jgi:hypothetical protein